MAAGHRLDIEDSQTWFRSAPVLQQQNGVINPGRKSYGEPGIAYGGYSVHHAANS